LILSKGSCSLTEAFRFQLGETAMGDKGSRDKAKKEQRKKPKLTQKEKRKLKNEKKHKQTSGFAE
jgi:hypothetical protein